MLKKQPLKAYKSIHTSAADRAGQRRRWNAGPRHGKLKTLASVETEQSYVAVTRSMKGIVIWSKVLMKQPLKAYIQVQLEELVRGGASMRDLEKGTSKVQLPL